MVTAHAAKSASCRVLVSVRRRSRLSGPTPRWSGSEALWVPLGSLDGLYLYSYFCQVLSDVVSYISPQITSNKLNNSALTGQDFNVTYISASISQADQYLEAYAKSLAHHVIPFSTENRNHRRWPCVPNPRQHPPSQLHSVHPL